MQCDPYLYAMWSVYFNVFEFKNLEKNLSIV